MKKVFIVLAALLFAVTSCTLDKTDYGSEIDAVVTEHFDFKETFAVTKDGYQIKIETLNGTLYKGYNEIRLTIINTNTNENVDNAAVTFLPISTNATNTTSSCPHQYNLEYNVTENFYKGYVVFTSISATAESWELYLTFTTEGVTHAVNQPILVEEQSNKNLNMTSFTGTDGGLYFIALVAPQKPKIAENQLVAGIYKYNQPEQEAGNFPDASQFSFSKVDGYTLALDPRMPEPSMGNHSSINNQDLTQQVDGLYYGIVNYTMTGNWTLNFILKNKNGLIIKGTEVSNAFTPGIEGTRSELYIDILF